MFLCSVFLGPVVQSVVSLATSLRVISLTVLADSIHNILIFFAEKIWVGFAVQKLLTFFQQRISSYLRITRCTVQLLWFFKIPPPNRWGWFFSPPRIFLIPHSNSDCDGFFVHRVSAEFPPQNHPLTCRTPRWAKVYPSELAMKD